MGICGRILTTVGITVWSWAAFAGEKPSWIPLVHELNLDAGSRVVYELQVRTANACREDIGTSMQKKACHAKAAPEPRYRMWLPPENAPQAEIDRWVKYWQARGKGTFTPAQVRERFEDQKKIKLGTLDDLLENTSDYRQGVTVKYLKERLGVGTIWLMPLFPSNDSEDIPYPFDNLGSPYAVTDYMHASGSLSRACIKLGRSEYEKNAACWANAELKKVIQAAHARGMKVMLDVAFNHFGRNYHYYDYLDFKPVREQIAESYQFNEPLGKEGGRPGALWDFGGAHTYDERLLYPEVLDTESKLQWLLSSDAHAASELRDLQARCRATRGRPLEGDERLRAFGMWRNMLDWERERFDCSTLTLEVASPGHYAGLRRDGRIQPAQSYDDLFYKAEWADTRFLYHHMDVDHLEEYVRNREYLFRVMNYWTSMGVDGFRLDHTIDRDSGANAVSWNYLIEKVKFYAHKRGQETPVFLAEEFDHPADISWVVDAQTEGYVGDIVGHGKIKDADFVKNVLFNGERFSPNPPARFGQPMGSIYVMRGIATHDDPKPFEGSGLDEWTAAGFWGVGAASRAMAMMLVGQEWGEREGLSFKQSSIIRSRFDGVDHDPLVDFYGKMSKARQDVRNRALISSQVEYLPAYESAPREQVNNVVARVHRASDGNVMLSFNSLWPMPVLVSYAITPGSLADALIEERARYRLVEVFSDEPYPLWHGPASDRQRTECVTGDVLKMELNIAMRADQRLLWLRLEKCE